MVDIHHGCIENVSIEAVTVDSNIEMNSAIICCTYQKHQQLCMIDTKKGLGTYCMSTVT